MDDIRHPTSAQAARRTKKASTPVHHRISDELRQAIVAGEFLDGDRLVVDELARRFDTSAMPVRQALHHLESEGLVVTTLNRGARVRRVDQSLAENLYDLRGAVLRLLVERCAERISDEQVIELADLAEAGEHTTSAEEGFVQDEKLFAKIGEIANIPQAAEVLDRTWPLVCAVRRVYGVRDRRVSRQSMNRLLEAIGRRDAKAAVARAEESVQSAKSDLMNRIASQTLPGTGSSR